jgi:hypothetical protein
MRYGLIVERRMMIATIRASSPRAISAGVFEAIKHGLEYEIYDDGHFDIIVHQQYRADAVAKACNGKIMAVVDHMPVYSYKDETDG